MSDWIPVPEFEKVLIVMADLADTAEGIAESPALPFLQALKSWDGGTVYVFHAPPEAGEVLEDVDPEMAAKYALAVCRYRLGEYEPAIAAVTEVLADAKFQQRDEALAVLGHSQLAGNNYEKALAAFRQQRQESQQQQQQAAQQQQIQTMAADAAMKQGGRA